MVGQSATKPSRSDEVLDADEQERIANQIREQFDSLAPKRPIKPNRSEPDPDAPLDHSSAVSSHSIPELLKFQSFQSQPHAVFSDEGPKDVPDEFVETRYYDELSSIDKQHHTTGSGFIRVERVGGDDLKFQNTQIMNGGETKVPEYKSNPATNDWIPNINEHQNACFTWLPDAGSMDKIRRSLNFSNGLPKLDKTGHRIYYQTSSIVEDQLDPFSLVADELSLVANRLRAMVVAEVPQLASAAEYFFKMGVEGKRFRPTVLLLMSTALNLPLPPNELASTLTTELRSRQQRLAEITEMIHVASLLHDDVLDDADTRRGIGSLNFVMGNKMAVLAGNFLLSRACVALASLEHNEVVSLIAQAIAHLVTGETKQMTSTSDQLCSMEYYVQKTYYKTASLISNSCQAVALLAGQTPEVATLAFEYGKNLGLAYQLIDDVLDFAGTSTSLGKGSLSDIHHGIVTAPLLFAMEEFPQLRTVIEKGFDDPTNVDLALDYLGKSRGIQRSRELALDHAKRAASAIDSLPASDDDEVRKSRRALIDLTHRVITRTK